LVERRNVHQVHRVLDRSDYKNTDNGAHDGADASGKGYAAEHARRDAVHPETGRGIRLTRGHARGEHHARKGRHGTLHGKNDYLDLVDADTRKPRRFLVAADRERIAPVGCPVEEYSENNEDQYGDDDRYRNTENRTAAESEETRVADAHRAARRYDETDTAHYLLHGIRGDERVDLEPCDDEAVYEADEDAGQNSPCDADQNGAGLVDQHRRGDAGKRDDRLDGKVEIAGCKAEQHGARHHADHRNGQRESHHVPPGQEVGNENRYGYEHDHEDNEHSRVVP